MDTMQPGQVIAPQGTDQPQQPVPPVPAGAPQPDRPLTDDPGDTPEPAPVPSPTPESQMAIPYTPSARRGPAATNDDGITWTASEFIAHEKSPVWYGIVALGGVVAAGLAYWLVKDIVTAVVILFAAIAFLALSAHRPRTQQYSLTYEGLQIGGKVYYFHDFKNFSVTEEGAIASVVFMPLKRFMPPLTIYVVPDMEDEVLEFLSDILPFEQHRSDAVDGLMRRIRF